MTELQRTLARVGLPTPLGTLTVLLVGLASGLALTVLTFSSSVLRLPGVSNIGRLGYVFHRDPRAGASGPTVMLSGPDYRYFRSNQRQFDKVTAYAFLRQAIAFPELTSLAWIEAVDADYFDVMGVPPLLGRTVNVVDSQPGQDNVIVLSETMWRRHYLGEGAALGTTVTIRGRPLRVIGVVPQTFSGAISGLAFTGAWVPLSIARDIDVAGQSVDLQDPNDRGLFVAGVLRASGSWLSAQAEASAIGQLLDKETPIGVGLPELLRRPYQVSRAWVVLPRASYRLDPGDDRVLIPLVAGLSLLAAIGFLMTGLNLGALSMASYGGRTRVIALRLALGAPPLRLIGNLALEGSLLALAGCSLGLLVARFSLAWVSTIIPSASSGMMDLDLTIDDASVIVAFGGLLSMASLVGFYPALRVIRRIDVVRALASGNSGVLRPKSAAGRRLIAAQVSVAVILISVASQGFSQVRATATENLGFDVAGLSVVEAGLQYAKLTETQRSDLTTRSLEEIRKLRHVESAAVVSSLPSEPGLQGSLALRGQRPSAEIELVYALGDFVSALGLHQSSLSTPSAPSQLESPSLYIDSTAADVLFGGGARLGEPVTVTNHLARLSVEGRLAGVLSSRATNRRSIAFLTSSGLGNGPALFVVRSANSSRTGLALTAVLRSVAPEVPINYRGSGATVLAPRYAAVAAVSTVAGVLGTLLTIVAAAGLHGTLSSALESRRAEVAVKLALGARASQVNRELVLVGAAPVLVGTVIGLSVYLVGLTASRPLFLRPLPWPTVETLVIVSLAALSVAVAACYIPARRLTRLTQFSIRQQL